ncbi:unnamed protein product [Sphagnum jensenii]|uniref:Four helix bundle protein n=1 Tax=Sphagnum jensenii TaxID=128206 RepID=A0ABP0VIM4_9BRYO
MARKVEKAERPFEYSAEQYRVLLSNFLNSALRLTNSTYSHLPSQRSRSLKASSEKESADYFRVSAQYEMIYCINRREFSNAGKMLEDIEACLIKYKRFITPAQMVNFPIQHCPAIFLPEKIR